MEIKTKDKSKKTKVNTLIIRELAPPLGGFGCKKPGEERGLGNKAEKSTN
jgi:hypothetical protein